MTGENLEPTRGQLERNLSQRILALYRSQLGHQPTQVSCTLVDEKLIIVLENALTPPEQLLVQNGQESLAQQVRSELEMVIQSQLKELIEKVLEVPVTDILNDSTLETGRTGTIAILKTVPKFRDVVTKSKGKSEMSSSGGGGE